jgi:Xaa-Pro aminopeptidase
MEKIDNKLFRKNRDKVFSSLPENSIAFVVSSDEFPRNGDQSFRYRQNSDLFYLTGINQEQTVLMYNNCHPDETKREILFVRRSDELLVTWYGHKYSLEEASEISGIKNVKYYDELEGMLGDLMFYAKNVYLSTNGNLKYQRFFNDSDYRFLEKLRFLYPLHNYQWLSPILVKSRLVKEQEEIEIIKQAIKITKDAFLRVLKFVRNGVGEYEVEAEITHEFIRQKAFSHAYSPIVASGVDNNILHYTENNKICNDGDLLLLDFGAEYMNYAADLSRTIPVNGRFSEKQLKVYKAVLKVQEEAKKIMRPGQTINNWNKEVGKIMEEELLNLGLLTKEDIRKQSPSEPAYKRYYMHGTGHFLGLDVHDVGTNDTIWKSGMILTDEPGIYVKEWGFGIRLENDILITEDGNIDLMAEIPILAEEIEELMNK